MYSTELRILLVLDKLQNNITGTPVLMIRAILNSASALGKEFL